jgi:two-component system, OmpR family, sensor histidine kinase CiaH
MFKEARVKLTVWYLAIIMAISLSFSGAIYIGINNELVRLENFQRTRIQVIIRGFPVPVDVPLGPDNDAINEARFRIISVLGFINLSILILSGLGGYFLAGQTLDPIAEMVDEQKEFVSNASHELRTPLTSLMTEIEVALRDKQITLSEAKSLLASNLEEVKKMNNLSNLLLKLNKVGDEKTQIKFKQVDLKEVALGAISKVTPLVSTSKIKIIKKLKSTTIRGNEESLTELAIILLDNAIKYSEKGKSVEIKTFNSSLEITDHGIGISNADLPHIFDRFYRADSSRSKEQSNGYGLGLSIAKSIVDLHGAQIKIKSKIGKGSTFTVIFS